MKETGTTGAKLGKRVRRAQSIISRLAGGKHRADPVTAVRIVIATEGAVTLDDLYKTPPQWRADRPRSKR